MFSRMPEIKPDKFEKALLAWRLVLYVGVLIVLWPIIAGVRLIVSDLSYRGDMFDGLDVVFGIVLLIGGSIALAGLALLRYFSSDSPEIAGKLGMFASVMSMFTLFYVRSIGVGEADLFVWVSLFWSLLFLVSSSSYRKWPDQQS